MSPEFHWQTEDEQSEGLTAAPAGQVTANRALRLWLTWLMIVLLVGLSAWVIWTQLRQQVAGVSETVEKELLASHRLVETAAHQMDIELFTTLLSGRDPAWTEGQWALLQTGLFVDRTPFGLTAVPEAVLHTDIALSPELNAAEIVTHRSYQVHNENGLLETVTLAQTAAYRRSSNRQWLLSPPNAEFWGEPAEIRLPYLVVTYPARDEAVVTRLAVDLERQLEELCRVIERINCPPGFQVTLDLNTDSATLATLADLTSRITPASAISLPTPTLLGWPVDDVAYKALLRGYARQLLSPAIGYLLNWECCLHHLYYAASLDWQLSQLGLQSWPLTGADYVYLLPQSPRLETLRALWYLPADEAVLEEDLLAIYALVEFIFTNYGGDTSWVERQRRIPLTINFRDWLLLNHPVFLNVPEIENEWYDYMAQQAMAAQANPPVSLPDKTLYLACHYVRRPERIDGAIRPALGQISLFKHTLEPHQVEIILQQEVAPSGSPNVLALRPSTDYRSLQFTAGILAGLEYAIYTWVWQNNNLQLVWPPASELTGLQDNSYVGLDPSASRIVYAAFAGADSVTVSTVNDQPVVDFSGVVPQPQLITIADCEAGDCKPQPLPGWPFWSPDGRQMIIVPVADGVTELQDVPLLWANGDGEVIGELGLGAMPIWISEDTAVVLQKEPEPYIYLVDPVNLILQPEFAVSELLATLPEEVVWGPSHWLEIVADPANPQRWFIFGSGGYWRIQQPAQRQMFIVAYDRGTGRLEPLHFDGEAYIAYGGAGISGDGRYLSTVIQTSPLPRAGGNRVIRVFDAAQGQLLAELETSQTEIDGRAIWSPDGRWLVAIQDRVAMLYAPEHDYRYLVGLNQSGCRSAAWAR
jgi:hypothetical protein